MKSNKTKKFQKIPSIETYLADRKIKNIELNKQSSDLKIILEKEIQQYEEVILFSIPYQKTAIFLSKEILSNFFSRHESSYAERGLFLKKINIVYQEYIDINLYCGSTIWMSYVFTKTEFNHRVPLKNVSFKKRHLTINEATGGVGFCPALQDEKKFLFIQKEIEKIVNKVHEAQHPIY